MTKANTKSEEFPFRPGQVISRNEIHRAIGGSFRHGMTSCLGGNGFAIFHNPDGGQRFGYDVWEGFDLEGNFHFTGQGKSGDQKLTRNNKVLAETRSLGIPIYLFMTTGDGEPYQFRGEYCLGSPSFRTAMAPDENGTERKVFIFNLIPVGFTIEPEAADVADTRVSFLPWTPPSVHSFKAGGTADSARRVTQREHQLQKEFGDYLLSKGVEVLNLRIEIEGCIGSVRPDFYLRAPEYVIEAKASANREFVRQAIGQVLDYRNLLARKGISATPSILLPMQPAQDLAQLITDLDIDLITGTSSSDFSFSHSPVLATHYPELMARQ
jgi:hypothetical protein